MSLKTLIGVFVGVLVLGGVQEALRPHGQLSDPPRLTQPSAPASVHPNEPLADVREVRERPDLQQATPTSANTVPAPTGADAGSYFSPQQVGGTLRVNERTTLMQPESAVLELLSIAALMACLAFLPRQACRSAG